MAKAASSDAALFFGEPLLGKLKTLSDGESDRGSQPQNVAGVELVVVDDPVVVRLRTDEEILQEVVAQAAPDVKQQMGAVNRDRAGGAAASPELVVEDQGLGANAGHDITFGLVGKIMGVDAIHIVKNGAETLKAVVEPFVVAE